MKQRKLRYKRISILICLLGISSIGVAQSVNLRGGLGGSFYSLYKDGEKQFNSSEAEGYYTMDSKTKGLLSYNFGLTYEFKFNDFIHLETGILGSSKGFTIVETEEYKYSDGSFEKYENTSKVRQLFLDVPLLVQVGFTKNDWRYYCAAGPYAGFAFFGSVNSVRKSDSKWSQSEYSEEYNYHFGIEYSKGEERLNLGVLASLGVQYKALFIEAYYSYGFMDKKYWDMDRVVNQNVGFSLGFKFYNQDKK